MHFDDDEIEKLRREAVEKLRESAKRRDRESAHGEEDEIVIEFLRKLGFDDVADAWDEGEKWYG